MADRKRPHDLEMVTSAKVKKMMSKMNHQPGEGLGVYKQGIVEPIQPSLHVSRRGLGYHVSAPVHSANEDLVWKENHPLDSLNTGNRIWRYCKSDSRSYGTEEIRASLVPHRGPAVRDLEQEDKYCSSNLLKEVLSYKQQLDHLENSSVKSSHQRSNPYEMVNRGFFMNRAAMKLANMDALLDGAFSRVAPQHEILHFADICAGPGGFSEYLLWRRLNAPPLPSTVEPSTGNTTASPSNESWLEHSLNVKGYGFTLKGNCDFREQDFFAGPPSAFFAFYGKADDGDITKRVNLSSFSQRISEATHGKGVHVVVADGGFDVSSNFSLQEVLSKRIYLCQCLCALMVLRPGGNFLTKLFDTFTEFTVDLIFLMSQLFEEISIIKPVTSRPANSERYLFCKNLQSTLSSMAGCPDTSTNGLADVPESSDVLQDLIKHFLQINDELTSGEDNPRDVLRLCDDSLLSADREFISFMVLTNEEFVRAQCVALSKLLVFERDRNLRVPLPPEMKERCFAEWHLPMLERKPVAWPILSVNHCDLIHCMLGDGEGRNMLNALPDCLLPNNRALTCTPADQVALTQLTESCLAFVCAHPWPQNYIKLPPMMFYSSSSSIYATTDGQKWDILYETLRIPPGTLLWGQFVAEYSGKGWKRIQCLWILDVACIYGHDCRHLPYTSRIKLAERMVEVVSYPSMNSVVHLRVPPKIYLSELESYANSLSLRSCKDHGTVPTDKCSNGRFFVPYSLIVVKFLKPPWISACSRSTGKIYYYNTRTHESTFDLPTASHLPFAETGFLEIPWNDSRTRTELLNQLNFVQKSE